MNRIWLALPLVLATGLGLAVVLGQSPTPAAEASVPVTGKKSFQIPVEVKPGRQSEIRWMQLWASRDRGQTWDLIDQQKNDRDALTFRDRGDGSYWVNMVIEYNDGHRDPADVSQVAPAMKFVLDTVPPVVTVTSAVRSGEELAVEWTVEDKNPNPAATAIYVRAAGVPDAQWQQAPAETVTKEGTARFKTTIPGAVVVMVTTADLARNVGSASKEVPATMTASYTPPTPKSEKPAPTKAPLESGPLPPPSDFGPTEPGPVMPSRLTPMQPQSQPPAPVRSPPPVLGPPPGNFDPPPVSVDPPFEPMRPREPGPGVTEFRTPAPVPESPTPLRTVGSGDPPPVAPPAAASPRPVAEPPTVQVIRTPRFDLGYQVDGGVSGVAKIVLYVTRDEGRTWRPWSTHDGRQTPLKVVLDDPRINRDVEGDYGFRLVPVSGAGLSDTPPAPGTPPDMRVHIDMTPPKLDIYAPQADPANRNALVLIWKASDRNFGREPILVEYGDTVNGPWKAVTAGDPAAAPNGRLPNTGSYSWTIPPGLSAPQVYLRMTAWDLGGNKTERITERPILVDLTRPRARIQGIVQSPSR